MSGTRLGDLGERRIVAEILGPRYADKTRNFGDDAAAVLAPAGGQLVITTDPCPPPMASLLGFSDLFYRGWLLATINLSDLAAAGAAPLGLVTSLMLPRETTVAQFSRLLDGIDACCAAQNTVVLGGNVKEFGTIELSATAVGHCDGFPLTRSGAQPGDQVVVIGELGRFWVGSLSVMRGLIEPDPEDPLLRTALTPAPKVAVAVAARRAGVLTSCMDNSDGLSPSLRQLATASAVRIVLYGDRFMFDDDVLSAGRRLDVDLLRLALGWGDWQLVGTCPTASVAKLQRLARATGTVAHAVGEVRQGTGVGLMHGERQGELMALESERFAADSWFSAGLDSYIEAMLRAPLIGR